MLPDCSIWFMDFFCDGICMVFFGFFFWVKAFYFILWDDRQDIIAIYLYMG